MYDIDAVCCIVLLSGVCWRHIASPNPDNTARIVSTNNSQYNMHRITP